MILRERLIRALEVYGLTNALIVDSVLREVNYRPEPGYYWDNLKEEPCEVDEFGLNYFHDNEVYPYTSETSLTRLH